MALKIPDAFAPAAALAGWEREMIVRLLSDGTIVLDEADRFRAFSVHVAADPMHFATLRNRRLDMIDFLDRDTAWVSITALASLDAVRGDPAWQKDFAAMIAAAKLHGWINEAGTSVRAHVTWQQPAPSGR